MKRKFFRQPRSAAAWDSPLREGSETRNHENRVVTNDRCECLNIGNICLLAQPTLSLHVYDIFAFTYILITGVGIVSSKTSFDHGPRPMQLTAHTRILPMFKECGSSVHVKPLVAIGSAMYQRVVVSSCTGSYTRLTLFPIFGEHVRNGLNERAPTCRIVRTQNSHRWYIHITPRTYAHSRLATESFCLHSKQNPEHTQTHTPFFCAQSRSE